MIVTDSNTINKTFRKPKLTRQTAGTFNLAAFALPVIYNVCYKRYCLAAAFLLFTAIPHLNRYMASNFYLFIVITVSFASLFLAIWSGVTGNVAAYEAKNYENEKNFIKVQSLWFPITIIALLIHLFILPAQFAGHINEYKMIKIAEAQHTLQTAMNKAIENGDILGQTMLRREAPQYFAKYMDGEFDNNIKIEAPDGNTYFIKGQIYDCGKIADNVHHELKTSCGYAKFDLNGEKGPNFPSELYDLHEFKNMLNRILNHRIMGDIYTFYIYEDGVVAAENSIEQYALKRFERRH